ILTVDNLVSLIDKSSSGLSCAWERNSTAWPISSSVYEDSMSPEEDIAYIKEYLKDRLTILDDYINHPPIIKIGDSYALINEEAHTIFCSLPPGADTVQEVSWECWPGAEVYMELLSLGEIGLYKDDFSEYSGIMANGRNTGEITIYIDNPRKDVEYPELNLLEEKVLLNGWALDPESKEGTGVERILVFDGPQTNKENFLGEASYGLSRPDVAQHFGNANYENSGYELCINTFHMENGKHELYIYVCDKNGGYSLEIYPIEVENKNNEADEIKESKTAKLENGGYYDFENFIYHGNWIINDKGTERTYDFWLTTGDVPIAVIDTNNQLINNQDKINAEVKIMYHDSGENNFINENNIDFTGRLGIKIRGKSSQGFPKKQYSIEIVDDEGNDMNVSLLGMPKEADWILGAPYTDKTFMRNMLAFELSNQMGYYAPRTRFVELFLNDREDLIMEGGYEGIYMLTERIKRDDDRVNIQTLDADDTDISGGYILEISSIDRVKENESSFTTERGTTFTNIYPDKKRITAEQKEWISGYINELEKLIYSDDFLDEKEGYAQYLDTGSLINYMIINELFKNRSLFWESTYLYKDRGGKLMVGPVWDFDLSAGKKGLTPEANNTLGWRYEDKLWIEQIFQDKKFVGEFIKKWNYFRQGPISDENIENIIDSNVEFLEDARIRNYKKWDILGKGVWPSCPPIPETYEEEIDTIKSWFFERTEWIDENIDSLLNNK
ncbi:MAG: CotH kinase family protein, partial [Actinobacteria bacterium]|nr:CotH kinase family protein [Actinomycetota bacterium]